MSDETALTVLDQAKGLVISASGSLDFGASAEIINWAEVAEAIDPRGPQLKVADVAGRPFTIQRLKPFLSAFHQEETWVFWAVCQFDNGQIFNTVLGGAAVVEELRNIIWLNAQMAEARDNGDVDGMQHWMTAGAGKKPRLTIQLNKGGKYGRYYTVARSVNGPEQPLIVE